MKLFRTKRKPENGEEEKQLVLDTGAEEATETEEGTAASTGTPAPDPLADLVGQPEPTAPEADPLARIGGEAAGETPAGEKPPDGSPASPPPEDPLDADLLELFREAKNEVEETTLASELPDIPIQELLGDLVSISQRLGVTPKVRRRRNLDETSHHRTDPHEGGK